MSAGALVYVWGTRGPEPQRWPRDAPANAGVKPLARHELSAEEFALGLDLLAKLYPPPPPEDQ